MLINHYSTCVAPNTRSQVAPAVFNLPKPVMKGSTISPRLLMKGLQRSSLKYSMCKWAWWWQCQAARCLTSGTAPNSLPPSSSWGMWQDGGSSPGQRAARGRNQASQWGSCWSLCSCLTSLRCWLLPSRDLAQNQTQRGNTKLRYNAKGRRCCFWEEVNLAVALGKWPVSGLLQYEARWLMRAGCLQSWECFCRKTEPSSVSWH